MENHKDWLAAELVNLMHQYSSEYLGVCLDFNNNLSLLEDPYEVVKALAPYTIATHFKDARISLAPDGLLLGDVVLGAGVLDLARMLDIVREGGRKPKITLEMITRPPLRVPVFSPEYWNTFPERPGMRLAQTIAFGAKLPADPSSNKAASPEAQGQLEEDNVKRCLQWSAEHVT
jgi:hypothetical protein